MRISYWSSDVCSSDLAAAPAGDGANTLQNKPAVSSRRRGNVTCNRFILVASSQMRDADLGAALDEIGRESCRGRSVSRRVDLGGRRIIKKKKEAKIMSSKYIKLQRN